MKKAFRKAMLFLGMSALVSATSAGEANLTRFGPKTFERFRGAPQSYSTTFNAVDGPADIVINDDGIVNAKIKINGVDVVNAKDFRGNGEFSIPLHLYPENTIEVSVRGKPGGKLGVRVTQFTESTLNVRSKMYFGINTSDMVKQRSFYRKLGLIGEIFPAGPPSCEGFARSLGFEDDYLIFVELRSLTGAPPWIDTVQFREDSFRDDPPYANLNHIGMAYSTYATTDLQGDYDYLASLGVEFVSPPAMAPNGEKFAFLKDQDGTYLKLVEEPGDSTTGPDLQRLVNTNMNVADLERSREFYRLLGFTEETDGSQAGAGEFAMAHGFDGPIEFEGVDISLPGDSAPLGDAAATLQLRQWKQPFNGAPPYDGKVNHLGIDRIAFYVDDLNATIAEMTRLGFEDDLIGPFGGGAVEGAIGIVFYYDPDGIKVEFWGPVSEPNPDNACPITPPVYPGYPGDEDH